MPTDGLPAAGMRPEGGDKADETFVLQSLPIRVAHHFQANGAAGPARPRRPTEGGRGRRRFRCRRVVQWRLQLSGRRAVRERPRMASQDILARRSQVY